VPATQATRFLAVLTCAFLVACSDAKVRIERDDLDGRPLRTYARQPSLTSEPIRESLAAPWLDDVLREAVDAELAEKDYRPAPHDEADFAVGYFVLVTTQADAITLDSYRAYRDERAIRGGYFWPYPFVTPYSRTTVYRLVELILTASTPAGDQLHWQASATMELDPNDTDADRRERFRQAARAALRRFPSAD
jgi:hypothetical protein